MATSDNRALCEDCPCTPHERDLAMQQLRDRQYTLKKEEPSSHKICLQRRLILEQKGKECPYFPKHESILYFTSDDSSRQVKERLRKDKALKEQLEAEEEQRRQEEINRVVKTKNDSPLLEF
ncbi:MAG: hypothetical protein WC325_10735 [Candidatus Bathyarchaeia archaeon]|jgi:hypothetical protein